MAGKKTGKKSFAYQGAHIFNQLEKAALDEIATVLFQEKLKLSKSLVDAQENVFDSNKFSFFNCTLFILFCYYLDFHHIDCQ